jgi:hypothetical protein
VLRSGLLQVAYISIALLVAKKPSEAESRLKHTIDYRRPSIVSRVRAVRRGGGEVPVQQQKVGNSLTISFQGQPEQLDWEIQF